MDPDISSPGFEPLPQVKEISQAESSFFKEELDLVRESSSSLDGAGCSPPVQKFEPGKCPTDDALSICKFIAINDDNYGDETQKFLRRYRDKLSESLVVDVLSLVRNAESGVKFFLWAGRQIGYRHSGAVYNALLEVLGCSKSGNRVPDHFLREIRNEDEEVLGKLLNVLIRKCSRKGSWNMALEELGRLKDYGYRPSSMTYNALILAFLRANKLETASLVYREMSDEGLNMDCFTLGCFVHSLCKAGRWREALELVDKDDFVPNTGIFNKMISGLCDASLSVEAMDFLSRMRSKSCLPNVMTYRILLCGFLKERKLGWCEKILSMMMMEGCYPSLNMFNSLVHAYCQSRNYSYAYNLLNKISQCGYQPGYVVYNILIGGICRNEELPKPDVLELAEKAYVEMLNAGIVLNKINFSSFANCLCGAGKFERVYCIIFEMMSKGLKPDCSTYSKVIEVLCNASKIEKAFLLFVQMKKSGITPDVYVYNILINTFCKAGLIQQAQKLFDEMVRDGCSPSVVTYTTLIHACLKARKVANANELYQKMLSEGGIPNIVTYTALIDGHCKAGDIERACQIYARMREKGNVGNPGVDMYFSAKDSSIQEPNVFTYGALVDGLCKAHKVTEARDLLDAMSKEGCEPNHIVYDALIDGFCKTGKLDEAEEVLTKMSEQGYGPNVVTYSSFIDRMFKDKRLDIAVKVLSKMIENSCAPNVVVYTVMIDGLCKAGKTDEAQKLMLMMGKKGCQPNVVTYTAMIDGLGKAGKVRRCLELFKEMGAKGCAPNFVTYRVLINHCCAVGLLDEAQALLEEMKQTYWPQNRESYRKVIDGFNRDFLISVGLLDDITKNDEAPIVPVYKILIDSLYKAGRLNRALELHKEVSLSASLSPADKTMYSSFIESVIAAGKVDEAFKLYAEMISRGGIPELGTFTSLIRGLIKANRWKEALELTDALCQMGINWIPGKETSERS